MKTVSVRQTLKRLKKINDEIRYADCFSEKQFTSGLIAFGPKKHPDRKQITHADKDLVCQVIKGSGRLRVGRRRVQLRPGIICHIPRNTPHDFAAGRSGELVLFYSLITTG
ncbi:MAG TPA: AraC family ligand binding domain-containing protein [Candidatus Binatia bacterium]|nr:AraC family ligand binding domain-containing protein [Candidatus Binatia bacterium]